jgi:hypothetical protein
LIISVPLVVMVIRMQEDAACSTRSAQVKAIHFGLDLVKVIHIQLFVCYDYQNLGMWMDCISYHAC